jgi:hypothetical protein
MEESSCLPNTSGEYTYPAGIHPNMSIKHVLRRVRKRPCR